MTAGVKRAIWIGFGLLFGVFALVVVVATSMCRGTPAPPAPNISGTKLKLETFAVVEGTDVFRAELHDESGFGSGRGRTRNIAFVEKQGQVRWLVPDDKHVITEEPIPPHPRYSGGDAAPPVAFAALVKPVESNGADGVILLYDPLGHTTKTAAVGVVDLHAVALSPDRIVTVLYEQRGQYKLATFDVATFDRRTEVEVTLPALR